MVGIVETHGRYDTAGALVGLELLPRREIEHRGRELEEFDLDARARAAARAHPRRRARAHQRAGLAPPKRWQDVEELLDAGIDVYTTLNVQHLESLNDVVGSITGVACARRCPTRSSTTADEVVLVDLPADELLERLQDGKVYMPEQAERAAENFFRKGNLIALRELALRRTADRGRGRGARVPRRQGDRRGLEDAGAAARAASAPTRGASSSCAAPRAWRSSSTSRWHAVYVETPRLQRLPAAERERILRV